MSKRLLIFNGKIARATIWLTLILGSLLSCQTSAEWSSPPPLTLSPTDITASQPRVAVSPAGDAIIVWGQADGGAQAYARRKSSAGVLGRVVAVSPAGSSVDFVDVGIDGSGNAVVMWRDVSSVPSGRLQARTLSLTGALGPVIEVGSDGSRDTRIAVNESGHAVFLWNFFDGANQRLQTRSRSPGGTLSAVQTITPIGEDAFFPDFSINSSGDAAYAWGRVRPGMVQTIFCRTRSANGALSAFKNLSGSLDNSFVPEVALTDEGDLHAVWTTFQASSTSSQIFTRARRADGSLSPRLLVSAPKVNAGGATLAWSARRELVLAWSETASGFSIAYTRRANESGQLGASVRLSDEFSLESAPELAVDANGLAAFVWGARILGASGIKARTQAADGTLEPLATLTAANSSFNPQIAMGGGQAVAVWRRSYSNFLRVQAAVGP